MLSAACADILSAVAVALMHFVGMAGLIAAADVRYEPMPILIGFVVAATLFSLAYATFGIVRNRLQIPLAALPSIIAVCALHFTAMSATTLVPNPGIQGPGVIFDKTWLIAGVVAVSTMLIILTIIASVIDRYLTDLKGLSDAALEGILVVQGGKVIEANAKAVAMAGLTYAEVLSKRPDDLFRAFDGLALGEHDVRVFEGAASAARTPDQVLEFAMRNIEYRGRDSQVVAIRDLSEQKAAQRQIEHMAKHDALTGLGNRTQLADSIRRTISSADPLTKVGLLSLDLDRFKAINDVFGHAEGDVILQRVAELLRSACDDDVEVFRVGGDEFMMLSTAPNARDFMLIAQQVLDRFENAMNPATDPRSVGISVGIAVYPDDATDIDGLRHASDLALYRSKQTGRGRASFFDAALGEALQERLSLEHDLRHSLWCRQIWVAFQPIVNPNDGQVLAYEALMRWSHPQRGDVEPEIFIPVAEDNGFIIQLGEWMLREACKAAATWPVGVKVTVNVSPVQFRIGDIVATIANILEETGCEADRLELEITESVLLKDRASALETLSRLKALGVSIAMDDFGTGYSSLSNLQSFPFDKIKIDRSFVASMADDPTALSIVKAIVGLGRSMDLLVVAEGVETTEQRRMVIEQGCQEAQGFLFGRPRAISPATARPSAASGLLKGA